MQSCTPPTTSHRLMLPRELHIETIRAHYTRSADRPRSVATDLVQVSNSTERLHADRAWKSHNELTLAQAHRRAGSPTQWRYVDQTKPSAPPVDAMTGPDCIDTPGSASSGSISSAAMTVDERSTSHSTLAHPSSTAGVWIIESGPMYASHQSLMADANRRELLGYYLNDMQLPQSNDVAQVYRVEPRQVTAGRSVDSLTLCTDMMVRCNGLEQAYLFTMDSREAAIDHGMQVYGIGNFELFRLDTRGMPAVRYRSHVQLSLLADDTGPLQGEGAQAHQRGDVYLDLGEGLDASRIHRESPRRGLCCTIL